MSNTKHLIVSATDMGGFLQTAVIHIRMDFANKERPTSEDIVIGRMRKAAFDIIDDYFHQEITVEILTDKEYNEILNNGQ